MKILIISLPRTGSTSLMYKIANDKNLLAICEPFDIRQIQYEIFPDNCVVKSIIKQHPKDVTDIISFYLEFSKSFDEIILLSRKNLKLCWESLAFFTHHEEKGFKSTMEYYWENTPNINHSKTYVMESEELLLELSNKLEIKIVYYEDLFDENSTKKLRKGDKKDNIKLL